MKRLALMALAAAAACQPPLDPAAKRWPMPVLVDGAKNHKTFGGFDTTRLVELLPDGGSLLRVLPAFEDGQRAGLVITDLWENHPAPWVQPVYLWNGAPEGVHIPVTLGVDTGTGFYSPFWKGFLATARSGPPPEEGAHDVDQLLQLATVQELDALVLCPIGPALVGPSPMSGLTFQDVGQGHGWASGTKVTYLHFDATFTAPDQGVPDESRLFAFTRADGRLWELPMVLPSGSKTRAFVRRFDLALQQAWAVYVPQGVAPQAELADAGILTAPVPVAGFDPAQLVEFEGRVAVNADCFDGGFPTQCQWLDSEANLDALVPGAAVDSHVTASAPSLEKAP